MNHGTTGLILTPEPVGVVGSALVRGAGDPSELIGDARRSARWLPSLVKG
jgi:hypothetical protein